jgi:hypothetical protein
MSDVLQRLREALVDRYAVEREIDRGGMAMVSGRREPPPRPQTSPQS